MTKRQVEDYLAKTNDVMRNLKRLIQGKGETGKTNFRKTGVNQRLVVLAETIQAAARQNLAQSYSNMESGTLAKGIQITYIKNPSTGTLTKARIHIKGPAKKYAKFVEFGTGILGEEEGLDYVPRGWVYNATEKGETGWPFKSKTRKVNRGSHNNPSFSSWFWTYGQPGKAFMYNAYLEYKDVFAGNDTTGKWYKLRFGTEDRFSPYIEIIKQNRKFK